MVGLIGRERNVKVKGVGDLVLEFFTRRAREVRRVLHDRNSIIYLLRLRGAGEPTSIDAAGFIRGVQCALDDTGHIVTMILLRVLGFERSEVARILGVSKATLQYVEREKEPGLASILLSYLVFIRAYPRLDSLFPRDSFIAGLASFSSVDAGIIGERLSMLERVLFYK